MWRTPFWHSRATLARAEKGKPCEALPHPADHTRPHPTRPALPEPQSTACARTNWRRHGLGRATRSGVQYRVVQYSTGRRRRCTVLYSTAQYRRDTDTVQWCIVRYWTVSHRRSLLPPFPRSHTRPTADTARAARENARLRAACGCPHKGAPGAPGAEKFAQNTRRHAVRWARALASHPALLGTGANQHRRTRPAEAQTRRRRRSRVSLSPPPADRRPHYSLKIQHAPPIHQSTNPHLHPGQLLPRSIPPPPGLHRDRGGDRKVEPSHRNATRDSHTCPLTFFPAFSWPPIAPSFSIFPALPYNLPLVQFVSPFPPPPFPRYFFASLFDNPPLFSLPRPLASSEQHPLLFFHGHLFSARYSPLSFPPSPVFHPLPEIHQTPRFTSRGQSPAGPFRCKPRCHHYSVPITCPPQYMNTVLYSAVPTVPHATVTSHDSFPQATLQYWTVRYRTRTLVQCPVLCLRPIPFTNPSTMRHHLPAHPVVPRHYTTPLSVKRVLPATLALTLPLPLSSLVYSTVPDGTVREWKDKKIFSHSEAVIHYPASPCCTVPYTAVPYIPHVRDHIPVNSH